MNHALLLSGAILVATAALHSAIGERKLIGALLGGNANPRVRRALRYTWHMAGLLMALSGVTIAWPGTPRALIAVVAVAYLVLGGISLWMTKGRHISGPAFTAAAALALLGAFAIGPAA